MSRIIALGVVGIKINTPKTVNSLVLKKQGKKGYWAV